MIKLQGKLPRKIMVAVSGGVDSMAALDFLRRNHELEVFNFNHGTEHGKEAEDCVRRYVQKYDLPFQIRGISKQHKPKGMSQEDYWRQERYAWIDMFANSHLPVVTCHHLEDCVETWVWSSMHGTGKIVPRTRGNVLRPFRQTRKRDFQLWADLNNIEYVEDSSNTDTSYIRNYVRHEMMPHVLRVNPGIYKTISKKVKADDDTKSSEF
jgi:tRNA(Ile)-lysidine synthase